MLQCIVSCRKKAMRCIISGKKDTTLYYSQKKRKKAIGVVAEWSKVLTAVPWPLMVCLH